MNKGYENLKPIQKGEVRNPTGRPKGSRNLLSQAFIESLHEDFKEHGGEAIAMVRENDTSTYLRVIASIVPKEMTLNEGESAIERILDTIPDDGLAEFIEGVRLLTAATSGRKAVAEKAGQGKSGNVH